MKSRAILLLLVALLPGFTMAQPNAVSTENLSTSCSTLAALHKSAVAEGKTEAAKAYAVAYLWLTKQTGFSSCHQYFDDTVMDYAVDFYDQPTHITSTQKHLHKTGLGASNEQKTQKQLTTNRDAENGIE